LANGPTLADAVRHYNQGNRAAAKLACEQMLAEGRSDNDARLLLAILLVEDGDTGRGIALLQQIVKTAPGNARARHALAKALARAGQPAAAAMELEQVIGLAPTNIDAYLDLGGLHLRQNDPARAERVLRRALAVAPRHPAVLANLGGMLASHGNAAEAVEILRRVLAMSPEMPAVHYNLAIALKAKGDLAGAVEAYRAAIARKPDHVDAYHNLGNLLLDLGRVGEAAQAYEAGTSVRRRPGQLHTSGPNAFTKTNPGKLRHDIEQLRYLLERGRIDESRRSVVADYEAALAALPANTNGSGPMDIPDGFRLRLAPNYNRLLYRPDAPARAGGAVNRRLDAAAIEADYARHQPGITFVDDFLDPEALATLRRFCLEATVWFECRYGNGYLGAFLDDGFCCPLLLQIAEDVRRALPGIFGPHTLRKLWAFKYDSRLSGIGVHADFAALNVNFWVTPDDANLEAAGGGLVVWDKEAPIEWDLTKYNNDQPAIRRFLAKADARAVNVPYRQNRVVIFNSDLFHETAPLRFRDGYENRRINITMLYGKRGG
jgi:Flp pilus assembly protein TadD